MPKLTMTSCTIHSPTKEIQPRVDSPRMELVSRSWRDGTMATSITRSTTEARNVWIPNHATATAPRSRLASWAPRMPKLIRLMTGKGTPVFCAHEPGEAEQHKEEGRPDGQGRQDLPAAEAQGKESDGERVVPEAVHVVRPQGEDAVPGPAAPLPLGGCEVGVVKAGADVAAGGGAGRFAQGVGAGGGMDRLARQRLSAGAVSTPTDGVVCIWISSFWDFRGGEPSTGRPWIVRIIAVIPHCEINLLNSEISVMTCITFRSRRATGCCAVTIRPSRRRPAVAPGVRSDV